MALDIMNLHLDLVVAAMVTKRKKSQIKGDNPTKEEQVETYLKNGGVITTVPIGLSGTDNGKLKTNFVIPPPSHITMV